jgi:hypothetical protein
VQLKRGEKGVRFVSEIYFKALEDRNALKATAAHQNSEVKGIIKKVGC